MRLGNESCLFLVKEEDMPTLSLSIKYEKNGEAIVSPSELQALYFYGITIRDRSGKELEPAVWRHFILAAQKEIEKYLGIKIKKQIIQENLDFYNEEWRAWGYLPTTYQVVKPFRLAGFLGTVKQLEYPFEWLTSRKTNDGETYYRRVFLVPVQGGEVTTTAASVLYSGVLPSLGLNGWREIPNYWTIEYCTGFDTIPEDLLDVVGKLASLGIFNIAGDIALGQAALANYSLSIDGLSQSVGTTNSATNAAFGARIINYQKELKDSLEKLRAYYRGVGIISM